MFCSVQQDIDIFIIAETALIFKLYDIVRFGNTWDCMFHFDLNIAMKQLYC